ncbi:MAG TPA: CPBP family intramembrane glutamic endopeptidase [Prolixibacteraceae bacterium]|nr:CPBP family intramembrane glutamic endopeptidase [Prolixibacteraceae bacterium]
MEVKNNRKPTIYFIVIVLTLSYLLAGAYYLLFPEKDKISFTIMAIVYMFMPFVSALVVDKLIMKRENLKSWSINFKPNKWFLAAWPAVIIFVFFAMALNILWPGISFSPNMDGFWERMAQDFTPEQIEMQKIQLKMLPLPYWLVLILQALIAGFTINAVAGFGEESAWRGFMVKEYRHLNFWDAAMRIGIVWGIWHAPLILMGHNYPEHPLIGVGMMTIWCLLVSPLFLYVRLKTKSVIAASIMHGTINASAAIAIVYLAGGNDLTLGITGFSGFIALLIVIGLMIFYDLKLAKHPITNRTIAGE